MTRNKFAMLAVMSIRTGFLKCFNVTNMRVCTKSAALAIFGRGVLRANRLQAEAQAPRKSPSSEKR